MSTNLKRSRVIHDTSAWVPTKSLWRQPGGHIVHSVSMIAYIYIVYDCKYIYIYIYTYIYYIYIHIYIFESKIL